MVCKCRLSFVVSVTLWLLVTPEISLQQDMQCSEEGAVRLVGGRPGYEQVEGRVELCLDGVWGTVCDDDWDSRDASVVCKQLGFPSEFSVASKFAHFGEGIDPIHRDETRCTGSEERLIECAHNETHNDCGHHEDAGVQCQGPTCVDGDVRLIDGTDYKEGRVEICLNNTWGSICESGFNETAATVVCNQLGLGNTSIRLAHFSPGVLPVFLEGVQCYGNESNLAECILESTVGGGGVCPRRAGVKCEPPCTSALTDCVDFSDTPFGNNLLERCFCTPSCVRYGDCCRDFLDLDGDSCDGAPLDGSVQCTDNDIRLVDGTQKWNGRLEVCLRGYWGSVCELRFEDVDAQVVCNQLGYTSENAFALPGGTFGETDVILWLSGVECRGNEANVTECQNTGAGNFIPCSHRNDTAVWCAGAALPECTDGEIRLVNGTTERNGRVEMCYGGIWGSVCNNFWDDTDAAVVCRELGHNPTGAVAIHESTSVFGRGIGPFVLDDVECSGAESSLSECSHPGFRVHNCFRYQEAGVSCREGAVEQCDSLQEQSGSQLGNCELYQNGSDICDTVFTSGVDYIYLPHRRGLTTQADFHRKLHDAIGSELSVSQCQEDFSTYVCSSFFFPCGKEGEIHRPNSVCSEDCLYVQNTCSELWEVLLSSELGMEDFADCNTTGEILEPLEYCCVNVLEISTGDSEDSDIALIAGVAAGGLFLVLIICCCTIIIIAGVMYFMSMTKKVNKLKRTALSIDHQTSMMELVEFPARGGTVRSIAEDMDCATPGDIKALNGAHRYTKTPGSKGQDVLPTPHLIPPRPPSPITSKLLRQLPPQMLIPSTQIRLLDCIGQGEFGIVYKAHLLKPPQMAMRSNVDPQTVAVKTLKGFFDSAAIHEVLEESVKMKSFSHRNVLSMIGVCLDAGSAPYLLMPYMANGSLLSFLKKERENLLFPEGTGEEEKILEAQKRLLNMCSQIARGMEYLAEKKFVHRDLAARNCMIDSQYVIRVSDFGLSEDVYAKNYFRQGKDSSIKLPVKWMAPESLTDGIFSEKTDVWSFGVTCWEVFSGGKTPYPGVDPLSLIKMLERGARMDKPFNDACPDSVYEMICHCWKHNPDKRPTFTELISEIASILLPLAGYLQLETITGIIKDSQEEEKESARPKRTTTSIRLSQQDLVTPVGIVLHLDPCPDDDTEQQPTNTTSDLASIPESASSSSELQDTMQANHTPDGEVVA